MDTKNAERRYFLVLIPATILFVVASFGIDRFDNLASPGQATLIALSIVPIFALLVTFWGYWRFLQEIDEYLRAIQIKALLVGLITLMIIVTSWGYLEAYADAGRLELLWLYPIFCIAYSIGAMVFTFSDRGNAP